MSGGLGRSRPQVGRGAIANRFRARKTISRGSSCTSSAGDFSISMPLDRTAPALLAIRLNETNLSVEHGAPVRLVVPGGECFTSIKWLDHLELRSEPGLNTAETIALARVQASPKH